MARTKKDKTINMEITVAKGRPKKLTNGHATPAQLKEALNYSREQAWEEGKNIPAVPENLPEPQLSETALYIGKTRYARRNEKSEPIESAKEIFWRVGYNVACADLQFDSDKEKFKAVAEEFYRVMAAQKFIPNTPTLLNAGKPMQQLSACFVLPIEDDMKSIAQTLVDMVMIHKSGGGTGFSFSKLQDDRFIFI